MTAEDDVVGGPIALAVDLADAAPEHAGGGAARQYSQRRAWLAGAIRRHPVRACASRRLRRRLCRPWVLAAVGLLAVRFARSALLMDRILQPPALEVVLLNAPGQAETIKSTACWRRPPWKGAADAPAMATRPMPCWSDAAAPGLGVPEAGLLPRPFEAMRQAAKRVAGAGARAASSAIQSKARIRGAIPAKWPAAGGAPAAFDAANCGPRNRMRQPRNARPRKRFFSPTTREAVFAACFSELRRAVGKQRHAGFPGAGWRKTVSVN
jgi:protein TonB